MYFMRNYQFWFHRYLLLEFFA
ncbi:hypothetical protein FQP81_19165 [Pseudoalteromonas distincta]|nr:hypothetical protein FQP81_19165 [Pseudoalteromonas elyakovii]